MASLAEAVLASPELCARATQALDAGAVHKARLMSERAALPMRLDASALPAHTLALLAQAIQFGIDPRSRGRTDRIFVQQPLLEAPDDGYPLIVMLDGNLASP